jgi:uncharacterized membrane protein YcaP (DUF421 family)
MFFENWTGILRVAMVGSLAYIGLVVLLRVSGKRTLSKLNAFDLVVTVALGSTLSGVLLDKNVALLEGLVGFGILILGQYVVTALSVRSARFQRFVKAEPRLLVYRGRLLRDALREERVTDAEIAAVVREQGLSALEDVDALVLETDGSFDVVTVGEGARSALRPVTGFPPRATA